MSTRQCRFWVVLTAAVLFTACSNHELLDEKYQPLARAVQQGNGFFEIKLDEEPETPINGQFYMEELRANSITYYDLLKPYKVEVQSGNANETDRFSVTVYDDGLIVLWDCNNTPGIDHWYYQDADNTRGEFIMPPCAGPFEMTIE